MKENFIVLAVVLLLGLAAAFAEVAGNKDGEVRRIAGSEQRAWDAEAAEWVSLDLFWERYAARRGGFTWGKRKDYPPYADVSELDTLVIQLDSGSCMMMFFHTRWRRANDVRRWDDAFNDFSACPDVFD